MAERSFTALWPLAVLGVLAALGLAAQALDLIDWRTALDLARDHAERWWLPPTLVLLQVALFAFGLPGSAVLWLAAPLYPPAAAAAILTAGGCGGALAAHALARRLSGDALARVRAGRGFRVLQREGDFLVLCALRLAPGMPHSVINYASGVLNLRLVPFLGSSALGFGLKSFLYSSVIHGALSTDRPADLLAPGVLGTLVGSVVVSLAARAWMRRRHGPGARGLDTPQQPPWHAPP
jgi:uncharacterized membrane protein YdjX (TVP38/TMEM64 family)